MKRELHYDIFCRVVDNFGDAGVCWRLARQLVDEHDFEVRLWIDDLASLSALEPAVDPRAAHQVVAGISVERWCDRLTHARPADIVIEAFGCGLPPEYAAAMSDARRRCVWIVLEYLSAEPWVSGHHAMPSPHPRYPVERYFFFPGFTQGTGGLLREAELDSRREMFDESRRNQFWRSAGHAPPVQGVRTVSMFAYETAPLREMLDVWSDQPTSTIVAIPEGRALHIALEHLGAEVTTARVARRNALEVRAMPFVPQRDYDELLWACDFNFVRGEDSFVRAQWARRPFLWNIYPQESRAHETKLDAFLALYCEGLDASTSQSVSDMMRLWNGMPAARGAAAAVWHAFEQSAPALRDHANRWARRIAALDGLAANLARFCADKLK